MKTIQVTYTTRESYSDQNQENIKTVMADLQKSKHSGINYNSCLCKDGKTFVHTAYFNSDDDQKILNELPSFKNFQKQLISSGLESPPKQEILTLVGSSNNIF